MRQIIEWHTCLIDTLCELKAEGYPFAVAWDLATARHRPRARDVMPEERPTLFAMTEDEETVFEFVYRVTYDAWHGNHPHLRHLAALKDGDLSFLTPGGPNGHDDD